MTDEFNHTLKLLIEKKDKVKGYPPQYTFVLEEAAEFQKEIMKYHRNKGELMRIYEELMDLVGASIVMLKEAGFTEKDVCNHILDKWRRAITRLETTGEF